MRKDAGSRHEIPSVVVRGLWLVAVLLAIIGVAAAVGRGVFPTDLGARTDPFRQQLLHSLHRNDPFGPHRAAEVRQFDSRFGANPTLTLLHIVPGGIFLTLAPLQFSSRIRSRHIRFHRWSGRVLVLAALVSGLTALYFGLLMPFGGPGEAVAIALFGGLFMAAVSRAFFAIRRRDVARHREWMIRAFALAIAISTIRAIATVLDVALTPAGFRPREIFVLSLWSGWVITLGAAELWIRYTCARVGSIAVPAGAPEARHVV